MKYLLFIAITLSSVLACKPKTEEVKEETSGLTVDQQNVENEVMKVHDDVMPKMADINRLAQQLKDVKSKYPPDASGVSTAPAGLDEALESLREAEQMMMDWMKAYHDTKANITPDLMDTFLDRELQKITEVKTKMLNSIDQANAWLAANPS